MNAYDAWSEPVESIMEAYAQNFDDLCRSPADMTFEWFASDADGCIAVFFKGEEMDVPRAWMQDRARYLCVIESLLRLPFLQPLTAEEARVYSDAGQFRRRGLYVFDMALSKPTLAYEVIERPPQPVTIDILPPPARAYLRHFRIEWVRFADCGLLDFEGVDMTPGPPTWP